MRAIPRTYLSKFGEVLLRLSSQRRKIYSPSGGYKNIASTKFAKFVADG